MDILRFLFYFKIVICACLFWLINSLYDNSNTSFIMRILSIITVEITNSLLGSMFFLNPIFNKILDLTDIHELYVIYMSIFLSFDDNIWRNTFIAHSFWIRLMIFASCIDLIPNLRRRKTIIAFYI